MLLQFKITFHRKLLTRKVVIPNKMMVHQLNLVSWELLESLLNNRNSNFFANHDRQTIKKFYLFSQKMNNQIDNYEYT